MANQTITKTNQFFQDIDKIKESDKDIKASKDRIKLLSFMHQLRSARDGEGIEQIEDDILDEGRKLFMKYFDRGFLEKEIANTNNPFLRVR
jgi:hypothetical protein